MAARTCQILRSHTLHVCSRRGGGEPKAKGEKDRRVLASLEFQRLVEMGPPAGTA